MLISSNLDWFKYELIWEKDKPADFVSASKRIMKYHENIVLFYKSQPTYNPQKIKRTINGNLRAKYKEGQRREKSQHGSQIISAKMYDPNLRNPKSVLYFNTVYRNIIIHPTQKPVALFAYLIRTYTNPGDLVLDNAAGSGTTAIAAIETGRDWLLIEKDSEYYQIARERINKRLQQPFLLSPNISVNNKIQSDKQLDFDWE